MNKKHNGLQLSGIINVWQCVGVNVEIKAVLLPDNPSRTKLWATGAENCGLEGPVCFNWLRRLEAKLTNWRLSVWYAKKLVDNLTIVICYFEASDVT